MALLTGALLAGATGCQSAEPLATHVGLGAALHPLQEPAAVPAPPCNDCCKDRVYIFGVNGLDPLCVGNFNGLCGYLRRQGFQNTHFDQLYTCCGLAGRVRRVRRADPDARVALIGFSAGCYHVKGVANALAQDRTRVDLLVYLGGDYLANQPSSHPDNVGRVLNIRGRGLLLSGGDLLFHGADIDGARNCRLGCRHMLAPSRRETLELVLEELLALACPAGHQSPPPGPAPGSGADPPGCPPAAVPPLASSWAGRRASW
jgi:hypothetical protein